MDENKELNNELSTGATETTEEIKEEVSEEIKEEIEEKPTDKKQKKCCFKKFFKKSDKIKNQFLLKKGSYSVAITAAVLAGIILLNVLVGALSSRFVLDFDFSKDKKTALSENNIDYIKKIDKDVTVTFCGEEDTYSSYMAQLAERNYGVTSDGSDYYQQTVSIVKRYAEYNKKIKLSFVDTQSSEFAQIYSKYSGESLSYGDIIVSAKINGNERHKIVGFKDIYSVETDDTYAAYGYSTSNLTGNNIENALTRGISYVLGDKTVKVGLVTGHTLKGDSVSTYKKLLEDNNYEITEISDKVLKSIPNDLDGIVIAAPDTDFIGSEITALSEFLDNDSKLGKGLICFADVSAPYLKNFYAFLEDWGVTVEDGILYETDENNYMPEDNTTLGSYPTGDDEITTDMQICITGYNVPLSAAYKSQDSKTVTTLIATPESTIAAPKGTAAGFKDAGNYEGKSYATAISTKQTTYVDGTDEANSFVTVFSSVDFINSAYNEQAMVANKNLTLKVAEQDFGAVNSDISFVTKEITNESFADSVTAASAKIMRVIFMFLLPLVIIIIGIVIFIKRRNA